MSSVRAEISFALENRGTAPAAVARSVEETALALGIADLLDRPPPSSRAASCSGSRSPAPSPPGPSWYSSTSPPRSLTPSPETSSIWQLRRLNQERDTAVVLVEQRLERCLAAADRVLAVADGEIVCDRDPGDFLEWAAEHEPALQTPGARVFSAAGLRPLPSGVKQARAILRREDLLRGDPPPPHEAPPQAQGDRSPARRRRRRRRGGGPGGDAGPVLELRGVWHELRHGPAILRGVNLRLDGGEAVVLMGRNGAGKSTLLRHAGGLMAPTRGRVQLRGELALLLQNPGDLFVHERVRDEAPAAALHELGLDGLGDRHPRDLSSGQRQRLALAVVLGGERTPAAIALDEPTRGMDRAAKRRLAEWLSARAERGALVLVATHDTEFAVEFATRAVLLARGRPIADGPVEEVLAGGRYFTTESARILGGLAGVVRPEQAAAVLEARRAAIADSGGQISSLAGAGR